MNKIIKFVCIFSVTAVLLAAFSYAAFSGNTQDATASTAKPPDGSLLRTVSSSSDESAAYRDLKDVIFLYVGSPVAYVNSTKTQIDPVNMEVAPFIQNNTAMVPVRFISESLGGSVRWDQKSRTATIVLGNKSYGFTQGSAIMKSENSQYTLETEVLEAQGRTFVPLDKFVKILGRKAFYDRGLIIISDMKNSFDSKKDKAFISEWISKLSYLPAVGSREKLLSLLEQGQENNSMRYGYMKKKTFVFDEGITIQFSGQKEAQASDAGAMNSSAKVSETAGGEASGKMDYSSTNVQVQGVDEGDIVKTDGGYIYQVNKQRIVIAQADPPENMKIISKIEFPEENLIPREIYIHGKKLIVIGSSRAYIPMYKPDNGIDKDGRIENTDDTGVKMDGSGANIGASSSNTDNGTEKTDETSANSDDSRGVLNSSNATTDKNTVNAGESRAAAENTNAKLRIYPPQYLQNSTKVLIYDMSDRQNIKLLREVELEGDYISSRKIGSSLYLVANDYLDYYYIQNNEANATPSYRDTLIKDDYINVGYDSIRYFPGLIDSNYMIVAGIDVDGNEAANVSTYLGAGQNIYASPENLYVAVTGYSRAAAGQTYEENTQVYKFAMKDAKITYLCKGEVPGTVLNQFSMDESGSHFRIATTKGSTWGSGENISKNALYVLDNMLAITGKIDDMAPGERIYSVRFVGERAYVVTFKTVDPLFVIDLKDPAKPAILGALKIPGYSDYLHPYDENHIIGFGKDTVETKGQAYYQGMKIALFDVSDVTHPIQMFTEMIGDRGTDSELLHNHRALLFSKEKNLLAFPVNLMENKDGSSSEKVKQNSLQYGQFTFQGAYVYSLDLINGFKLKGRITHLSDEDYLKAGNSWYDSDKNVERIIYIDKTLYTLSNSMIKANAMEDLKEKGSIEIP